MDRRVPDRDIDDVFAVLEADELAPRRRAAPALLGDRSPTSLALIDERVAEVEAHPRVAKLQVGVESFYTVAVQPEYEMGKQATELLLARLSGNGPEAAQDIILPAEIRKRQSSAAAPGRRPSAR